ncbi:hypothetical protein DAPPUDRAFT_263677 [Daphnia pulex]|uniref:Uncharacterized protein n=1 Tax=Daphnia pulex TaxID=6669 RepID=E9HQ79_DAPPU|nr:hypothetical protein DAPPUDRAFT_263677 [Daphnia pulex]|eukprot:EFX66105.1 hypothetical protein DAPPUDRAFT_263677 [Daphnia pulex]
MEGVLEFMGNSFTRVPRSSMADGIRKAQTFKIEEHFSILVLSPEPLLINTGNELT